MLIMWYATAAFFTYMLSHEEPKIKYLGAAKEHYFTDLE